MASKKELITPRTAANLAGCNQKLVEYMVKHGFPCIKTEEAMLIERDNLPYIQKAVSRIRCIYSKVSLIHARELTDLARRYLANRTKE